MEWSWRANVLILALLAVRSTGQQVPPDCRFIHVGGAGTAVVNGWYNFAGMYERKFQWCRDDGPCGHAGTRSVAWSTRRQWTIIDRDRLYYMQDGVDPSVPVSDHWLPINQGRNPAPTVTCHKERSILPQSCPFIAVSSAQLRSVNGAYEPSTLYNGRRSWKRIEDASSSSSVYLVYSSSNLWIFSQLRHPRTSDALYIEVNMPSSGADLPSRTDWAAHSASLPAPALSCHAAPPVNPGPTPSPDDPNTPPAGSGTALTLNKPVVSRIEFSEEQFYVTIIPASSATASELRVTVEFDSGDLEVYMCCFDDATRGCPTLRDHDASSPPAEPSPVVVDLILHGCRVVRTLVYAFAPSPRYSITAKTPTRTSLPDATNLPAQKTFRSSALPGGKYAFFSTPVQRISVIHVVLMARQPFGAAASTKMVARMNAGPGPDAGQYDGMDTTSDQGTMACIELSLPEDGVLYVGITAGGSLTAPYQFQVLFNKRTTCRAIKSAQFPVFD